MVVEALMQLAAAGGGAVVGAMATDAWHVTRDGIARLFSRRGEHEQQAVLAELDRDAKALAAAGENERELMERELADRWRQRLVSLLDAEPDAADDLKDLVTVTERQFVQHIVARDSGRAFGVQGGNLHYHEHSEAPEPDETS